MSYQVKLQIFEGPLDLLLFLIKKEEIDIYEIKIAEITKQYLEYINLMQILDLEIAGEFILMASTLMRIKARMLLPSEDEEEIEDMKNELVRNLILYKSVKESAEKLSALHEEERKRFSRNFSYEQDFKQDDDYTPPVDLNIFDLITVFKNVLDRTKVKEYYNAGTEEIDIENHMKFIINLIKTNEKLSFVDLISREQSIIFTIATFLAILELSKRKLVKLLQILPFQDIMILKQ